MANKKTTQTSDKTKNVKEKSREVANRGCPRINVKCMSDFFALAEYINELIRYWGITYATFNVLVVLCKEYVDYSRGCTVTSICKLQNKKGNNYRLTLYLLDTLISRGLVEVIGKGNSNANLYAPTGSSLKILNATVSMMCAA